MEETPSTLQQAIQHFSNYANCHTFMTWLRWPDANILCPRCGGNDIEWLPNAKVFKCYAKHPRQKFSLKVGTVFEDSPLGLDKWLPVMWMLVNCKNGVSSWEIHRALGVTQKTAWFMLQRARLALQDPHATKLSGEVEADETFIGGKLQNMHKRSKRKLNAANDGNWGKTVVLGLVEREGRVRAAVAPTRKYYEVNKHVMANVEPGSTLFTDEYDAYKSVTADKFTHEMVNKLEGYVKGNVHVNGVENFWSLLKRSLKGTYVSVDPVHLQRYVDEQMFRFNNRVGMNDADRFMIAMRQIVGKRLTYDELIGKDANTTDAPTSV